MVTSFERLASAVSEARSLRAHPGVPAHVRDAVARIAEPLRAIVQAAPCEHDGCGLRFGTHRGADHRFLGPAWMLRALEQLAAEAA